MSSYLFLEGVCLFFQVLLSPASSGSQEKKIIRITGNTGSFLICIVTKRKTDRKHSNIPHMNLFHIFLNTFIFTALAHHKNQKQCWAQSILIYRTKTQTNKKLKITFFVVVRIPYFCFSFVIKMSCLNDFCHLITKNKIM